MRISIGAVDYCSNNPFFFNFFEGSPGSPAEQWVHENSIALMTAQVYNRPVYIQTNLTNDPFDWRKFE
jgi:hypothetical protein